MGTVATAVCEVAGWDGDGWVCSTAEAPATLSSTAAALAGEGVFASVTGGVVTGAGDAGTATGGSTDAAEATAGTTAVDATESLLFRDSPVCAG